LHLHNP